MTLTLLDSYISLVCGKMYWVIYCYNLNNKQIASDLCMEFIVYKLYLFGC